MTDKLSTVGKSCFEEAVVTDVSAKVDIAESDGASPAPVSGGVAASGNTSTLPPQSHPNLSPSGPTKPTQEKSTTPK